MVIYAEARRGLVVVVSTVPQPFLRPVRKETALVEVYASYADEPAGNGKLLGRVAPGQTLSVEYNPELDHDLRITAVPLDSRGGRGVDALRDADSVVLPINRMVDTPTLVQPSNATNTTIYLAVPPNRHATTIRFRVSPDADMSSAVETEVPAGNDVQGTVFEITRGAVGLGTLTRYVTVAFSAGNGYGPESAITTITFANSGGTGGTGGTPLPPGAMQPVTVS